MASLLSSLSGLSGAVVPTLFQVIEKNEPMIEGKIVETLKRIKTSNPTEYNLFLDSWRKLNRAIEASTIEETIEATTIEETAPAPIMSGGVDTPTGPAPAPVPFVEPTPLMVESTGPTGPEMPVSETTGPSFLSSTGPTGPTGPSILTRLGEGIDNLLKPSATGPTGGKKHRKRKTAKQHRKRTHRVKHRKH